MESPAPREITSAAAEELSRVANEVKAADVRRAAEVEEALRAAVAFFSRLTAHHGVSPQLLLGQHVCSNVLALLAKVVKASLIDLCDSFRRRLQRSTSATAPLVTAAGPTDAFGRRELCDLPAAPGGGAGAGETNNNINSSGSSNRHGHIQQSGGGGGGGGGDAPAMSPHVALLEEVQQFPKFRQARAGVVRPFCEAVMAVHACPVAAEAAAAAACDPLARWRRADTTRVGGASASAGASHPASSSSSSSTAAAGAPSSVGGDGSLSASSEPRGSGGPAGTAAAETAPSALPLLWKDGGFLRLLCNDMDEAFGNDALLVSLGAEYAQLLRRLLHYAAYARELSVPFVANMGEHILRVLGLHLRGGFPPADTHHFARLLQQLAALPQAAEAFNAGGGHSDGAGGGEGGHAVVRLTRLVEQQHRRPSADLGLETASLRALTRLLLACQHDCGPGVRRAGLPLARLLADSMMLPTHRRRDSWRLDAAHYISALLSVCFADTVGRCASAVSGGGSAAAADTTASLLRTITASESWFPADLALLHESLWPAALLFFSQEDHHYSFCSTRDLHHFPCPPELTDVFSFGALVTFLACATYDDYVGQFAAQTHPAAATTGRNNFKRSANPTTTGSGGAADNNNNNNSRSNTRRNREDNEEAEESAAQENQVGGAVLSDGDDGAPRTVAGRRRAREEGGGGDTHNTSSFSDAAAAPSAELSPAEQLCTALATQLFTVPVTLRAAPAEAEEEDGEEEEEQAEGMDKKGKTTPTSAAAASRAKKRQKSEATTITTATTNTTTLGALPAADAGLLVGDDSTADGTDTNSAWALRRKFTDAPLFLLHLLAHPLTTLLFPPSLLSRLVRGPLLACLHSPPLGVLAAAALRSVVWRCGPRVRLRVARAAAARFVTAAAMAAEAGGGGGGGGPGAGGGGAAGLSAAAGSTLTDALAELAAAACEALLVAPCAGGERAGNSAAAAAATTMAGRRRRDAAAAEEAALRRFARLEPLAAVSRHVEETVRAREELTARAEAAAGGGAGGFFGDSSTAGGDGAGLAVAGVGLVRGFSRLHQTEREFDHLQHALSPLRAVRYARLAARSLGHGLSSSSSSSFPLSRGPAAVSPYTAAETAALSGATVAAFLCDVCANACLFFEPPPSSRHRLAAATASLGSGGASAAAVGSSSAESVFAGAAAAAADPSGTTAAAAHAGSGERGGGGGASAGDTSYGDTFQAFLHSAVQYFLALRCAVQSGQAAPSLHERVGHGREGLLRAWRAEIHRGRRDPHALLPAVALYAAQSRWVLSSVPSSADSPFMDSAGAAAGAAAEAATAGSHSAGSPDGATLMLLSEGAVRAVRLLATRAELCRRTSESVHGRGSSNNGNSSNSNYHQHHRHSFSDGAAGGAEGGVDAEARPVITCVQYTQLLHLLLRLAREGLWRAPREGSGRVGGGTAAADAATSSSSATAAAAATTINAPDGDPDAADLHVLFVSGDALDSAAGPPPALLARLSPNGRLYAVCLWVCRRLQSRLRRADLLLYRPLLAALLGLFTDVGDVLLAPSFACAEPRQTVMGFAGDLTRRLADDGIARLGGWPSSAAGAGGGGAATTSASVAALTTAALGERHATVRLSLELLRVVLLSAQRTRVLLCSSDPLVSPARVVRSLASLLVADHLVPPHAVVSGAATGSNANHSSSSSANASRTEYESAAALAGHLLTRRDGVLAEHKFVPFWLPLAGNAAHLLYALHFAFQERGARTVAVRMLETLWVRYSHGTAPTLLEALCTASRYAGMTAGGSGSVAVVVEGAPPQQQQSRAGAAAGRHALYLEGELLEKMVAALRRPLGRPSGGTAAESAAANIIVTPPVFQAQLQQMVLRAVFFAIPYHDAAGGERLGHMSFEYLLPNVPYELRQHAAASVHILFRLFPRGEVVLHQLLHRARPSLLSPHAATCATGLLAVAEAARAAPRLEPLVLYALLEYAALPDFACPELLAQCLRRMHSFSPVAAAAAAPGGTLCGAYARVLLFAWVWRDGHPLEALRTECFGFADLDALLAAHLGALVPLQLLLQHARRGGGGGGGSGGDGGVQQRLFVVWKTLKARRQQLATATPTGMLLEFFPQIVAQLTVLSVSYASVAAAGDGARGAAVGTSTSGGGARARGGNHMYRPSADFAGYGDSAADAAAASDARTPEEVAERKELAEAADAALYFLKQSLDSADSATLLAVYPDLPEPPRRGPRGSGTPSSRGSGGPTAQSQYRLLLQHTVDQWMWELMGLCGSSVPCVPANTLRAAAAALCASARDSHAAGDDLLMMHSGALHAVLAQHRGDHVYQLLRRLYAHARRHLTRGGAASGLPLSPAAATATTTEEGEAPPSLHLLVHVCCHWLPPAVLALPHVMRTIVSAAAHLLTVAAAGGAEGDGLRGGGLAMGGGLGGASLALSHRVRSEVQRAVCHVLLRTWPAYARERHRHQLAGYVSGSNSDSGGFANFGAGKKTSARGAGGDDVHNTSRGGEGQVGDRGSDDSDNQQTHTRAGGAAADGLTALLASALSSFSAAGSGPVAEAYATLLRVDPALAVCDWQSHRCQYDVYQSEHSQQQQQRQQRQKQKRLLLQGASAAHDVDGVENEEEENVGDEDDRSSCGSAGGTLEGSEAPPGDGNAHGPTTTSARARGSHAGCHPHRLTTLERRRVQLLLPLLASLPQVAGHAAAAYLTDLATAVDENREPLAKCITVGLGRSCQGAGENAANRDDNSTAGRPLLVSFFSGAAPCAKLSRRQLQTALPTFRALCAAVHAVFSVSLALSSGGAGGDGDGDGRSSGGVGASSSGGGSSLGAAAWGPADEQQTLAAANLLRSLSWCFLESDGGGEALERSLYSYYCLPTVADAVSAEEAAAAHDTGSDGGGAGTGGLAPTAVSPAGALSAALHSGAGNSDVDIGAPSMVDVIFGASIDECLGAAYTDHLCRLHALSFHAHPRVAALASRALRRWVRVASAAPDGTQPPSALPNSAAASRQTRIDAQLMALCQEHMQTPAWRAAHGDCDLSPFERADCGGAEEESGKDLEPSAAGVKMSSPALWASLRVHRCEAAFLPLFCLALMDAYNLEKRSALLSAVVPLLVLEAALAYGSLSPPLAPSALSSSSSVPACVSALLTNDNTHAGDSVLSPDASAVFSLSSSSFSSSSSSCAPQLLSETLLPLIVLQVVLSRETDAQGRARFEWSQRLQQELIERARHFPRAARAVLHSLDVCRAVNVRVTGLLGVDTGAANGSRNNEAEEEDDGDSEDGMPDGTARGRARGKTKAAAAAAGPPPSSSSTSASTAALSVVYESIPRMRSMRACYWLSDVDPRALATAAAAVGEPYLAALFTELSGEEAVPGQRGLARPSVGADVVSGALFPPWRPAGGKGAGAGGGQHHARGGGRQRERDEQEAEALASVRAFSDAMYAHIGRLVPLRDAAAGAAVEGGGEGSSSACVSAGSSLQLPGPATSAEGLGAAVDAAEAMLRDGRAEVSLHTLNDIWREVSAALLLLPGGGGGSGESIAAPSPSSSPAAALGSVSVERLRSLRAEAAWRCTQWSDATGASLCSSAPFSSGLAPPLSVSSATPASAATGLPPPSLLLSPALGRACVQEGVLAALSAVAAREDGAARWGLRAAHAALWCDLAPTRWLRCVVQAEALRDLQACARAVLTEGGGGSRGPLLLRQAGERAEEEEEAVPRWALVSPDSSSSSSSSSSNSRAPHSARLVARSGRADFLGAVRVAVCQLRRRPAWLAAFVESAVPEALSAGRPLLALRWMAEARRALAAAEAEVGEAGGGLLSDRQLASLSLLQARAYYAAGRGDLALAQLQQPHDSFLGGGSGGGGIAVGDFVAAPACASSLLPAVYAQLLCWQEEQRLVPASQIVRDRAFTVACNRDRSGETIFHLGRLCHALARSIVAQLNSPEYKRIYESVRAARGELEALQRRIREHHRRASGSSSGNSAGGRTVAANPGDDELLRADQQRAGKLEADLLQEEATLAAMASHYRTYRLSSIRAYAHSLSLPGDAREHSLQAVFGLVELWLQEDPAVAALQPPTAESADIIREHVAAVPTFFFLPLFAQLAARLGGSGDGGSGSAEKSYPAADDSQREVAAMHAELLDACVRRVALAHPAETVWPLLALRNSADAAKSAAAKAILAHVARGGAQQRADTDGGSAAAARALVAGAQVLSAAYMELAAAPVEPPYHIHPSMRILAEVPSLGVAPPTVGPQRLAAAYAASCAALSSPPAGGGGKRRLQVPDAGESVAGGDCIAYFEPTYGRPGGINAPKRLNCRLRSGHTQRQLLKPRDDLRQDALIEQVFMLAETLFAGAAATRQLRVRTYVVVPLSPAVGVVEWVDDTVVFGEYTSAAHARYFPAEPTTAACRERIVAAARGSDEQRLAAFTAVCQDYTPVMHYFFHERYGSVQRWLSRQCDYTRSVAAASVVGFVVGLGDRHCSNILLHNTTAEVVHIDLGFAFDQGRALKVPETVPFRMTRNLVDGMGVRGAGGGGAALAADCAAALAGLRARRELLLSVLGAFLHDPLTRWAGAGTRTGGATRALGWVAAKLAGYEEGERLSVAAHVRKLLQTAQDPHRLCLLFHGWQAWV